MAITQVANPSSVPSAVADYEAQNAHISAFNNIVNNQPFILTNSGGTGLPAIKVGTYIQYGGNLYVVDTEDYAITGTPIDGNNYIRLSGSTTLTAEWVQDISSYVWNEVYGYKESGSYFLLPYLVVKDGTSYEKYSMGAVTVQYKMNQNVRTTDAVTFATVNTGQGANEVYKISNETFDISASTVSMSTMGINEIRFVTARLIAEAPTNAYLQLPSGGSYIVVGTGSGAIAPNSSPISGGTNIAHEENNAYKYFHGVIRRVS